MLSNFKYDITMKAHPKDYYKIPLTMKSLVHLNPQPESIYLISPDGHVPDSGAYSDIIVPIRDDEALPVIDKNRFIGARGNDRIAGHAWANLMSLVQDVTKNDFYLDVQADTFFLKEIKLLDEEGKPKLFKTKSNLNNNYNQDSAFFSFSKKMFGVEKITLGESYIIDYTMYNKSIGIEISSRIGSVQDMVELAYLIVDGNHHPADGEIYGNFIELNHKDMYNISDEINHTFTGVQGDENSIYEVVKWIEECSINKDLHSCSYHNWI